MKKYMLSATDVSMILDIKISKAYAVIRTLNDRLSQQGIMTVRGRVPKKYLYTAYGLDDEE